MAKIDENKQDRFNIELIEDRYNEPGEKSFRFTFNGYQWYQYAFTKKYAKQIVELLQKWINEK